MTVIVKPTVGRRVWFWPNNTIGIVVNDPAQPCDAGIAFVWNDRCINVTVAGHDGNLTARTSVPLLQDDDPVPAFGAYCTWMPYQQAQAATASQHPALAAARPLAPFGDGSVGGA